MRRSLVLGCVAAVAVLVTAATAAAGQGHHAQPVGAVYTETNSPAGNSVVVYDRFADGTLAKRQAVSTGGNGSAQLVGCGPCPILDSQNEVLVSDDGNLVFAVNAGSNTVSSFREGHNGLELVSQAASGGVMPESMALHGNSLYVLNVATANSNGTTGNVYGLKVGGDGSLSPLGTSQTLASAALPGHIADPRAIEISPNGKVLVATEISGGFQSGPPGRIDTFVVGPHGELGTAVAHPTATPFPFGFAFSHAHTIVVSEINDPAANDPTHGTIGTVSTYRVSDNGDVTPIDHKSSGGVLPCWVTVSKDGKTTWVVNTGGGFPASISSFGLKHGFLTPLALTAPSAGEFAKTDEDLSRDGKYLYVLVPQIGPPLQPSHIDEYSVGQNGSLTLIGSTPAGDNLGIGASGLSAR